MSEGPLYLSSGERRGFQEEVNQRVRELPGEARFNPGEYSS